MQVPHSPLGYLPVYKSDGTLLPSSPQGVTITPATWYIPFGGDASPFNDVHLQWDAGCIFTSVEVELSDNPDATPYSVVVGEWVKANLVGSFGSLYATSGTVTALTLAVPGGTAGGAIWSLINGARRGRLKIVVGGSGGVIKQFGHGKA